MGSELKALAVLTAVVFYVVILESWSYAVKRRFKAVPVKVER